jgi:hypothetical protein
MTSPYDSISAIGRGLLSPESPMAWYLRGKTAPLVLAVVSTSRRFAALEGDGEPRPGQFTHHLDLSSVADLDDEVRGWLRNAWESGG